MHTTAYARRRDVTERGPHGSDFFGDVDHPLDGRLRDQPDVSIACIQRVEILSRAGPYGRMLIAEFAVDSAVLSAARASVPDGRFVVDSEQILGGGSVQLLVWTEGSTRSVVEAAFDADPTVESWDYFTTERERELYRIRLHEDVTDRTTRREQIELGVKLLELVGTSREWTLRARFPDRASVREYVRRVDEKRVDVNLRSLYERRGDDSGSPLGVSEKQRQTLSTALSMGYYDVPRRAALTDIADELGISDQSVSERLRRGTKNVLTACEIHRASSVRE